MTTSDLRTIAFWFGAVVAFGLIGVLEPFRPAADAQTTGSFSSTSFARSQPKDFDTQSAAGNDFSNGTWSDGTMMEVVGDPKVFTNDMPQEAVADNRVVDLHTQLVGAYAPILRMHPSETVFPAAVEVMLENVQNQKRRW